MRRLQIEISEELFKKLKSSAVMRNVSLRKLVTRMVLAYIKDEERRR